MLPQLKALNRLMKFSVFAVCLTPALAYPANPTDDGSITLEKRTLNPAPNCTRSLPAYEFAAQGHSGLPDILTLQKSIPSLPY